MSDAKPTPASARLAHDLREIREARGLSLDALHEETKIPIALLEQFEATGLADHPMFNRVYLRSLVRAYADLIDLPTDAALDALDEALAGTYDGSLMAADEPEVEEAEAADAPAEADDPAEAAAAEAPPAPVDAPTHEEETAEEAAPAAPPPRKTEPPEQAERPPPRRGPERVTTPAAASEEAWDAVSPAPGARRREQPIDFEESRSYMQWVAIGVAVVVLIGLIYFLVSWLGGSDDPELARQRAAAADTTAAVDTTAQQPPTREPAAVGDTINVVVVAAEGPVRGLRITRDDDLRRPYWIEEGEAKSFPALNRIVLEDALDPVRLLVEGYEYPKGRRDDQGRIVLTRESAQAFLDSVSVEGPPVDLSAPLERVQQGPIQSQ